MSRESVLKKLAATPAWQVTPRPGSIVPFDSNQNAMALQQLQLADRHRRLMQENDKWQGSDAYQQSLVQEPRQMQRGVMEDNPITDFARRFIPTAHTGVPQNAVPTQAAQHPVSVPAQRVAPQVASSTATQTPGGLSLQNKMRLMEALTGRIEKVDKGVGNGVATRMSALEPAHAKQLITSVGLHGHKDFRTIEGITEARKAQGYRAEAAKQRGIEMADARKAHQDNYDKVVADEHAQALATPEPSQAAPVQAAPPPVQQVRAPERMGDGTLRNTAAVMTGKTPVQQMIPTQQANK